MRKPWHYLEDWAKSDRGPEHTVEYVQSKMQERWPGNYRIVVKEVRHPEHMYRHSKWCMEFDTLEDETMFMLRWS